MSSIDDYEPLRGADHAPGDEPARGREVLEGVLGYLVGLALAVLLTAVFFFSQARGSSGDQASRLRLWCWRSLR